MEHFKLLQEEAMTEETRNMAVRPCMQRLEGSIHGRSWKNRIMFLEYTIATKTLTFKVFSKKGISRYIARLPRNVNCLGGTNAIFAELQKMLPGGFFEN